MSTSNDSQPVEPSGNGHVGHGMGPAGKVEGITRNDTGQLVVRIAGTAEPIVDARVARCFPWSVPQAYVSIRNKDGKEVVLLTTLDDLDEASRAIIQQELRDKVFNPKITRIVEHSTEFGITSVTAETDRGPLIFQIRSRDDVRILSASRLLFRDADGNTYEVADVMSLDAVSQKFLENYL
jgi:hypothetical protein